ncbi:MAG: AtpZ/AtpI family protein [Bacteroidales bacterium]|nr:AtpZ/AtpI family protein [Bacteroidales bacterium]
MKNKKQFDHKQSGKYLNIPFQMLAIIGVGVFGGIKLDKLLKLDFPIFTVILTIFSVILSIYLVIKELLK